MTDNKFTKYLLLFAALVLVVLAMFWRELVDSVKEEVTAVWSSDAVQEPMHDSDFSRIRGVRFEVEHNNIGQIQVGDLIIVGRSDSAVVLSVRLNSSSSGNDYPGLHVTVLSTGGAQIRSIDIGPSEYAHGSALSSETVELHIPIRPGDASFAVSAFYRD